MPDEDLTTPDKRFRASRAAAVAPVVTLVAALLGTAGLEAQDADVSDRVTLEGEVVDASNNLPLEGAIVSLPGLGLTAVTDGLGYYRMDRVPAATHAIRVIRLGYQDFEAHVPVNGADVLALHLTPGPIPLEGIEVEVVGSSDLDWRPIGTSRRAFIGPGEIEDLRATYLSLDHILRVRKLPRAQYIPPVQPGGAPADSTSNGCLKLVTPAGACAMVVMDGVPIDPMSAGWMYQTSSHDIYSVRFLGKMEGFFRYGRRGENGVLEIKTHR